MERWLDDEEIKECRLCRGPVAEKRDVDGILYLVPVETRSVRIDFENDILWDKLNRSEKIIVGLRKRIKELEAR